MNKFLSMGEISYFYEPITESWLDKVKNENKDICLYHYTSTEVLDKILTNAAFRATNIFYLNDASEFKAGIAEIRKQFAAKRNKETRKIINSYLDEIEKYDSKNWTGIYTISFSTSYDNLNQWITYAKESGICIELDIDVVKKYDLNKSRLLLKQKSINGEYLFASENYNGFGDMEYGEEKKSKLANEIFESFVKYWRVCTKENASKTVKEKNQLWEDNCRAAKQYLALRASYLKVKGFSNEKEVRISFFPLQETVAETGELNKAEIKYNPLGNGILRPYLEIYFFQEFDEKPRCPIKSIKVGPSGRQQSVYDSIVHRMRYGEVNVWKYSLQERFDRLKEYIKKCVETFELSPIKDRIQINRIYYLLAKEWCSECHEVNIEQEKMPKNKRDDIVLSGDVIKHYFYSDKDEAYANAERCVEIYKKETFFSSHGILVDKSTIPYIY